MHCQKTLMDIVSRSTERIHRMKEIIQRLNHHVLACHSLSRSENRSSQLIPMSSIVIVAGSKYIGRYLPARKPSNAMLVLVVSHIKYLKVVVANTWDKLHQGGKKSFELSPQQSMSQVYNGLIYRYIIYTSYNSSIYKTHMHTSPWYQYHHCHSFA